MPRAPRLDAPLALHHVISRGIERCRIFEDDHDRLDLLSRLESMVTVDAFTIYAWALMPNHFHLLARTRNRSLSNTMRTVLGGYASAFNIRHQRCGHLFQNRFKSILVQEDAYFLELVRYIHLNPVRAGIVDGYGALATYPWTGHASLAGRTSVAWQDVGAVLRLFGRRSSQARHAYERFVANGLLLPKRDLDGGGLRRSLSGVEAVTHIARGREAWSFDERILGDSDFAEKQLRGLETTGSSRGDHSPRAFEFIEPILRRVASLTGTQRCEITSNTKRRDITRLRQAICHLALAHGGLSARQISPLLGIHPRTVLKAASLGLRAITALGYSPADLLPAKR